MFISIIVSYLPYTMVTAFTPGPNNIIALQSVSQNGWHKGKAVLLGIASGFLCVMVLCALFCYELAKYIPSVAGALKYVGAAYIVYLAIHVALDKPTEGENKQSSFMKGFLLQLVNVKIILYAITVFTGYILPYKPSLTALLLHAVCITGVGIAGTITWAAAGGIFQKFFQQYYRPFNIAMALILLWCAISLI